ncbi:hypothetical protein N7535_005348 [Penicillium sp. DV-2018c]|nr:hypothetical protein N7461_008929 [Penicillium sp. DV-2018c]KAJ5571688.1 hypothetical protein N7535_005348 [Penicillium sp. DV-2018c]
MSKPLPHLCTQGDAMSTTTDSETLNTPTGTSISGEPTGTDAIYEEYRKSRSWNCPWPDRTFIIRHPATKLVLGLEEGSLRLVSERCCHDHSVHWRCVKIVDGQWGLQNDISGGFIIVDPVERVRSRVIRVCAKADTWRGDQFIFMSEHPDGGYTISVRTDQKRAFSLQVGEDNKLLCCTGLDTATAWEFVRVDLPDSS